MRRTLALTLSIGALLASLPSSGTGYTSLASPNLFGRYQRHSLMRRPDDGIATVTIENGTTVNMNCDTGQSPILCSPTGSGAILAVSDLDNYLAMSSVTVTTNGSGGSQVSDIDVVSPLAWSAATTLTLDADHSINMTSSIMVEGSGSSAGLSLIINDGGKHGYLTFASAGYADFADTSNGLSINNASYTLVGSIADLASDIDANPSGNFALAAGVDAGGKTYKTSPITPVFYGNFEGLGNTISNLKIQDGTELYVGLFQWVSGVVENLNLANVDVVATHTAAYFVGGLAGDSETGNLNVPIPILYNDTVSGTVSCRNINDGGVGVGGLVGANGGTIIAAVSSANVTASGGVAGSLVGYNYGSGVAGDEGTIAYSSASGAVAGGDAGGLVGELDGGEVSHSTASGDVTFGDQGSANLGGLVGIILYSGVVSLSSASGNVTGNQVGGTAGGLVGVSGQAYTSGIHKVELSYATGNVTGGGLYGQYTGGLVGREYTTYDEIENSYAMGTVTCTVCTGKKRTIGAGGLTGSTGGPIVSSYATGLVTNGGRPGRNCSKGCQEGGVTGFPKAGTQSSFAYWDTETSEQPFCTDRGNVPGCKGQTTSELQAKLPKGFKPKI